jgi:hypothetical protein
VGRVSHFQRFIQVLYALNQSELELNEDTFLLRLVHLLVDLDPCTTGISFREPQSHLVLRLFLLLLLLFFCSFALTFLYNLCDLEVAVLSFILDSIIGSARFRSSILSFFLSTFHTRWNRPRDADSRLLALESWPIPLFRNIIRLTSI